MERLTLEEAIYRARGVAKKQRWNSKYTKASLMNEELNKRHKSDCIKDAEEHEQLAEWLEELKSYRDIGTPKDLKELKENGAFTGLELVKLAIMQKELKEYKEAEEQGLLIKLPVPLGTTVYTLSTIFDCVYDYDCKSYQKWKCEEDIPCEYEKRSYHIKETEFGFVMAHSIGETVFLTCEEAEKKLEETKNGR